ncbi:hypothetical protein G6F42_028304 [Rhizopus arrhizus]|nr:hypothetical protein G6F42_028304 [Rhizopus arrhizus]
MESDNKNGRQSTLDTNDSIMGAVDSSIRGIHGAMEAMYSRFEKTSQQTLEMTTGMAHLMERIEYIQASWKWQYPHVIDDQQQDEASNYCNDGHIRV